MNEILKWDHSNDQPHSQGLSSSRPLERREEERPWERGYQMIAFEQYFHVVLFIITGCTR